MHAFLALLFACTYFASFKFKQVHGGLEGVLRRLALRPTACRRLRRHAAHLLWLLLADDLDHELSGLKDPGHGTSDPHRIHNPFAATGSSNVRGGGPFFSGMTQSMSATSLSNNNNNNNNARPPMPPASPGRKLLEPLASPRGGAASPSSSIYAPPPPSLLLSPLARLQRASTFDPAKGPRPPHRYAAEQVYLDILSYEIRHKPANFSVADIVAGSSAPKPEDNGGGGGGGAVEASLDGNDDETVASTANAEVALEAALHTTQKFAFGFNGSGGDGDDDGDERDHLLRLCLSALTDMSGRDDERGQYIALKVSLYTIMFHLKCNI